VEYISHQDREILFSCSKTYNNIEEEKVTIPKKEKQYPSTGLTCWDDFNNKNSILDLISDEFKVVRNLKDKFVIKRFGAESPHSGYVYKDTGTMYLFSTGTSYDAETLYTPFTA